MDKNLKENKFTAKKTTAKKPVSSKPTMVKKPTSKKKTVAKKTATKKPTPDGRDLKTKMKTTSEDSDLSTKKKTTTLKAEKKKAVKAYDDEIVKDLEKEKKKITVEKKGLKKKRKGKIFYLIFSLAFYAGAFFYINNILYDNNDFLESALFAFAALFVVFVFIQFNVHMIIVNFFWLPFKYLYEEMKLEHKKKRGRPSKKSKKFTVKKYKSTLTLLLYIMIIIIFVGAVLRNGIVDKDKILVIITQSSVTLFVLLIIICSWQYLFNILPRILNKSIDAKNGFILTLSGTVMVIFLMLNIFGIANLKEVMIFILIIGFIALLGVNLNMIVGEINIFQNLRERHSSTVTRAVFLIFFAFHVYVILYASVIAYSIYQWNPDAYNFAYPTYENEVFDLYDGSGNVVDEVYDATGNPIDEVYNAFGDLLTDYYDIDDYPISIVYDSAGNIIFEYYNADNQQIQFLYDVHGAMENNYFYQNGTLVGVMEIEQGHTYADFLYYSVVTVSTLGYGDITPSSNYNIAMAWGGFLSFYGFTFFALSIGFVSNIAIEGITTTRKD